MHPSTAEFRRAWLDVDLQALLRNASRIAQLAGRPLLPMVKADGYGLGAGAVAHALEGLEPWGYGVATVEEGAGLRAAGITRPVVVFTPLLPAAVSDYARHSLRPVIGDLDALEAWTTIGGPFHVEIDTGMSRSGFVWHDGPLLDRLRSRLASSKGWEGVFTHFHSSDTDPAATAAQWDRFRALVESLPARPPLVHAGNSAACAYERRYAADLVRPGIFLYGGRAGSLEPEPVAALRARVVAVRRLRAGDTVSYDAEAVVGRETTVATLSIGYADGVPRALGNRGLIELGDLLMPILGRVTMDMVMVDAGDVPVRAGAVATLFGGRVSLEEQAALAGTNSYDLLTRVSARIPRRHFGRSDP